MRLGDWKHGEIYLINEMQLLTAKPCVFLCNLSEKDYVRRKNKWLVKVHQWVQEHGGGTIIPFSGVLEQKLVDMPADEAAQYLASLGENVTSALTKIIKTGFSTINLIYFFTAGQDEVKCWTIRKGFKAPQAAGTIHTDFERGFICAEVMSYDDLHEAGTESEVKAKGKYRQEGKNYVVKDGDVIFFKVRAPPARGPPTPAGRRLTPPPRARRAVQRDELREEVSVRPGGRRAAAGRARRPPVNNDAAFAATTQTTQNRVCRDADSGVSNSVTSETAFADTGVARCV